MVNTANVTLHHRIGDLEKFNCYIKSVGILHHRIGDLEINDDQVALYRELHHRIGDLEKPSTWARNTSVLHHRIGDLEIIGHHGLKT